MDDSDSDTLRDSDTHPSVSAWTPAPGSQLGAYRLIEVLGEGGMGQVFLAEHQALGRQVALKLLSPQFSKNPEFVARFFNEARAVNLIRHPHIVEVMDCVTDPQGFNYFIMELLEGRDLIATRARAGPFTLARAVRVVRQICAALEVTHQRGIVHRDLKPENIFLVSRGEDRDFVKVLDFGIAKLSDAQLTRFGEVLGTLGYMSPEQMSARPLDRRSDLFSLGILLYWLIYDRLPFSARTVQLAYAQTKQALVIPSISASKEPVPRRLVFALTQCLHYEPEKRIQSAAALDGLLADSLTGPSPARWRRLLSAMLVGVILALLGLRAAGLLLHDTPVAQPVAAPPISLPEAPSAFRPTAAAPPQLPSPATVASPARSKKARPHRDTNQWISPPDDRQRDEALPTPAARAKDPLDSKDGTEDW